MNADKHNYIAVAIVVSPWSRRDWRHWAIAIPLGAVLVFALPMFLGWG